MTPVTNRTDRPIRYAAGVSFVGPSNLITLLGSIPPYWEAARKTFAERMGDPDTAEGEAQLIRQSPLFNIDLSGAIFGDGPAQSHQIATLPLSEGYTAVLRNADLMNMREKMFRLQTTSDTTEDGSQVWKVDIKPADGSAGELVIWIDKEDYSIVRYEQVSPEMGGARIVATPAE